MLFLQDTLKSNGLTEYGPVNTSMAAPLVKSILQLLCTAYKISIVIQYLLVVLIQYLPCNMRPIVLHYSIYVHCLRDKS